MKTFDYVIKDALGIHVRPAGLLSKEGKKFKSTITIEKGGKSANTNKLMAIMALGVKTGETVTVKIEGEDEDAAFDAIQTFFAENL
ncbi:HPr family phosphocarrier protein [Candidatus Epulonipiscium viviparus]|uniref:HPr family phosphocarrier protein n=1 Tax=Candidatus Epulonipiscium viviparus TaxID=420336 RepID=UPI00016C0886|nr:HPr family phosphocarrier protein [Candidatus Epulopiscium viviparus]